MFWLSYERFSILCNVLLLKSAISSHNSCEFVMYLGKEKIMSGLSDFEWFCLHLKKKKKKKLIDEYSFSKKRNPIEIILYAWHSVYPQERCLDTKNMLQFFWKHSNNHHNNHHHNFLTYVMTWPLETFIMIRICIYM